MHATLYQIPFLNVYEKQAALLTVWPILSARVQGGDTVQAQLLCPYLDELYSAARLWCWILETVSDLCAPAAGGMPASRWRSQHTQPP